jgi:mannose-6-phosphate isomerase-like protein (cupin superfamily)
LRTLHRERLLRGLEPTYNRNTAESYIRGDGPRRFLSYRNLGTSELTSGRVHIHSIRALELPKDGIAWHRHSMSQLFMELNGWLDFEVDGTPRQRLYAGDFVTLGAGMVHAVPLYSVDHAILELCVPADYTTEDA